MSDSSADITGKDNIDWKKTGFLFLGIILFCVVYWSPLWPDAVDPLGKHFELSREGKGAIAIFLLAATWWVFEVVPIGVTSITIGVNLDHRLRPEAAVLLSVNETAFTNSTLLERLLGLLLCLPVHLYRLLISPFKPRTCRFEPTCSRYFLEAIRLRWPSERLRVADRGLREGLLTEMMAADGIWRRGRGRRRRRV